MEKRDRALIAFTLVTGTRDGAIASLPLGKVSLDKNEVFQDARDVRTKNAKTVTTFFFPIGGEARDIVTDWITFLREETMFCDADPLFPKPKRGHDGNGAFASLGVLREFWGDAAAIRRIYRERFEAADLPYSSPHLIRKTLMQVAFKMKLHPEALKAWSQNLSHDNLATSLNSYGKVSDWRTAEIMQELSDHGESIADDDIANTSLPEALAWIEKMMRKGKS